MGKIVRSKVIHEKRLERKGSGKTSKMAYPEGFYGASLRGIRIAPQKVRLVIDQIRGLNVDKARQAVRHSQKRAAYYIDRVILSAIGNADVKSDGGVSAEDLMVAECYVDEGPRLKRFLAGPMGRARPILRRMCHITVVLSTPEAYAEAQEQAKIMKPRRGASQD